MPYRCVRRFLWCGQACDHDTPFLFGSPTVRAALLRSVARGRYQQRKRQCETTLPFSTPNVWFDVTANAHAESDSLATAIAAHYPASPRCIHTVLGPAMACASL